MPAVAHVNSVTSIDTEGAQDILADRQGLFPLPQQYGRSRASAFEFGLVGAPTGLPMTSQVDAKVTAPIQAVQAKPAALPRRLLQQWEGSVITEPTDGEFTAVLRDRTDATRPEEQATFSMEDVSPADERLVITGAIFYWSIAYEDSPSGTRRAVSMLRFRRLPAWTRSDMRQIERDITRFRRLFARTQTNG